jgi:hypothetical protein
MEQYNEIFGWQLFYQLGGSMFTSCFLAYTPLRHWKTTSLLDLGFYTTTFVSTMGLFSVLYPALGSVWDASIKFKQSWVKGMSDAYTYQNCNSYNFIGLKSCYPFGIMCGCFFVIRCHTLLTFFSAISTYLIIMLQFDLYECLIQVI